MYKLSLKIVEVKKLKFSNFSNKASFSFDLSRTNQKAVSFAGFCLKPEWQGDWNVQIGWLDLGALPKIKSIKTYTTTARPWDLPSKGSHLVPFLFCFHTGPCYLISIWVQTPGLGSGVRLMWPIVCIGPVCIIKSKYINWKIRLKFGNIRNLSVYRRPVADRLSAKCTFLVGSMLLGVFLNGAPVTSLPTNPAWWHSACLGEPSTTSGTVRQSLIIRKEPPQIETLYQTYSYRLTPSLESKLY